jgi:hypothetical protein
VIRDNSTGQTTTVPDGGQAAPQWSRPLSRTIKIDLDSALWRTFRRPNARVVSATWGTSKSQVGLEGGTQQAPIGGSAFDVDGTGTVTLLDQVNRRALRFAPSKAPCALRWVGRSCSSTPRASGSPSWRGQVDSRGGRLPPGPA